MKENPVKARIRLHVGGRHDVILLSNPSGLGVVGDIRKFTTGAEFTIVHNPRYQSFGLGAKPGAGKGGEFPDFVGVRCVTITPDMVGQEIGVFFGIEAKAPGKNATPGQLQKIALLRSFGALAGVAHNQEEALEVLGVEI
jgi:hypothetical protein